MNITVCLATYLRAERLGTLLDDLVLQSLPPTTIVVVDNDANGSARAVVERRRARGSPCPIVYDIQPSRNISLTRNRTVELATGDWLAFIDDDERAPCDWLARLAATTLQYDADGATGPVEPDVPDQAPRWIRRGRFYDWPRMATGTVVPLNKLRFGNVLLRGALLRGGAPPFDPAYGLTGGEDGDLLTRLVQRGATLVWCDEAPVQEPVELARLSLRWLLLRALRGGQDFARHRLKGRLGTMTPATRCALFLRALVQSIAAAGFAVLCLPAGRHRAARWLLKASANLGKMSVFFGWHYAEYGRPTPWSS
jgi:succinoglycan biosynthesis protein ExoM